METTKIMESAGKIFELAEKYTDALNDIKSKRELWNTKTHQLIKDALTSIVKASPIGWHVQDFSRGPNLDTVNISFGQQNSGLVVKDGTRSSALVKHGGYLTFSPIFNGNVSVFMSYPYIEDHIAELPAHLFERIPPQEITVEYITDKVQIFLGEMLAWEKSESLNYVR